MPTAMAFRVNAMHCEGLKGSAMITMDPQGVTIHVILKHWQQQQQQAWRCFSNELHGLDSMRLIHAIRAVCPVSNTLLLCNR